MDAFLTEWVARIFGSNVWLFVLVGMILAVFLFCVRKFARPVHALLEVVAGVVLLYLSFHFE
jgi:hypothetical protein